MSPVPGHHTASDARSAPDAPSAWRVWLMLLPQRRFSPAELARVAPDTPGWAVRGAVLVNVLILLCMHLAVAHRTHPPVGYLGVMLSLALFTPAALELIWRDPSRPLVRWGYYVIGVLLSVMAGALQAQMGREHREAGFLASLTVLVVVLTCWAALMYRHRVISLRLAELDERDRALELARQLGAAQIQPHFLFNTLASVQHWVSTGDARAAPLLAELTAYLRATLPLFEQRSLTLDQELEAVRRYLAVMQARLGERLRFQIDADPASLSAPLPPGLLLTLVENAVEHGVQPQLAGGQIWVRSRVGTDGVCVQVEDDGPGLPADGEPAPGSGHLGLVNTRERLARAFGAQARLRLGPRPGGGCRAELCWPVSAQVRMEATRADLGRLGPPAPGLPGTPEALDTPVTPGALHAPVASVASAANTEPAALSVPPAHPRPRTA